MCEFHDTFQQIVNRCGSGNVAVMLPASVTVKRGAHPAAAAFAKALLARPAQTTFAQYGFGAP